MTVLRNGNQLMCDDCFEDDGSNGALWCEHVQYLMIHDQGKEWSLMTTPYKWSVGDYFIQIPMIPTMNMWEDVMISEEVYGENNRKVTWLNSAPWNNYSEEPRFVCMLAEGEGRFTIRSILFEMCKADETSWNIEGSNGYRCSMSSHGYLQEQLFQSTLRKANGKMPSFLRWSLYTKGSCLSCLRWTDTSKDIPETDDKRFPTIKSPARLKAHEH